MFVNGPLRLELQALSFICSLDEPIIISLECHTENLIDVPKKTIKGKDKF